MFLASHMMAGGLVFDSVRTERRWLKWLLFIVGAYLFHFLMDSTPVWHDMNWPWDAWQWFVAAWNGFWVCLWLWQLDRPRPWTRWLKKVFAKRLLIGGIGWLSLDIFWLYRPWGSWLHGLAPNMGRWADPMSFIWEAAFIGIVCWLGFRQISRRRAATTA